MTQEFSISGKPKIPELVAPAGSSSTFLAGLKAGADAFYLGIGSFNARARAQNFALEDLYSIIRVARENSKKIYLALNILIHDEELADVIRILERIEEYRVDAVIIQDLGVLYLIRNYFPAISIHASTQMFLHNSMHIEALARHGISRVILPRELRLDEVSAIRRRTSVELEIFLHGALCFSFSGLCLASSYLFGASGNRGLCKQVCRFAFGEAATRYPFSMKDLEGRSHLEALLRSGVDALKIEGRLRTTDYVQEVVSYYRQCLDAYALGNPIPEPPQWRYSRKTTSGYLTPLSYRQMICTDGEPWIGEHVGHVIGISKGKVTIAFNKPVSRGERMRIIKKNGVKVYQFTLLNFHGNRCEVEINGLSTMADTWKVYRVGASQAPSLRCLMQDSGRLKTCPLTLSVQHAQGTIRIEALVWGKERFRASFPVGRSAAHKSLDEERIKSCFEKVDRTPFLTESIHASLIDPLALPIRELNSIRREFYRQLERFYDSRVQEKNQNRCQTILREFEAIGEKYKSRGNPPSIELIPYEELRSEGSSLDPSQTHWVELPLFVAEESLVTFLRDLQDLLDDTSLSLVCHSLGWVDYLRQRISENRIASGGYLYCGNRFAYKFLREQGAYVVFLSNDFPKEEIKDLMSYQNIAFAMEEPCQRFFVTRQPLPSKTYRLKDKALEVVRRKEYAEVICRVRQGK